MALSSLYLVLMCWCCLGSAHPWRGLQQACKEMMPGHKTAAQTGASPFVFDVGMPNNEGFMNVTLKSSDGKATFKGFLIQVRNGTRQPLSPPGRFLSGSNYALAKCSSAEDTIHHKKTKPLPSLTIVSALWDPQSYMGKFYFQATVVQEFHTFWVNVESPMFERVNA